MESKVIKDISLDLYDKKFITVNAKQNDRFSRFVRIACLDQNVPCQFGSDTHCAFVRYRKPDSLGVYNTCGITGDGKILVELTEQMTAVPGTCLADVMVVDRSGSTPTVNANGELVSADRAKVVSTMNFYVNVTPVPIDNSEIESSYEFNALNDLIEKATTEYQYIVEQAKASMLAAQASEKNSKASETNAKNSENVATQKASDANASAGLATQKANDAATSANTALTNANKAKSEADKASNSVTTAKGHMDNAEAYKNAAHGYANDANGYKNEAAQKASDAEVSRLKAQNNEEKSKNYALYAQSYAKGNSGVRENEGTDNAEYFYGQCKSIVENFSVDDQTPSFTQAAARANIASGEKLSVIFGKVKKWFADLKAVAFSGSYNDLTDQPTVGNGTLTIQKNGTNIHTFTANQTGNVTANISVPTKTSDLTNDSGFKTTDTTYGVATQSANGLLSSTDKAKLDGIATGANNYTYTLPTASTSVKGGIKTGYAQSGKNYPVQMSGDDAYVNVPWTDTNTNTWKANSSTSEGYVASGSGQANKVWKTDASGNPGWRDDANTTYSDATTSTHGLLSSADKGKLDGIATGANNYNLPLAASGTRGGIKIGYSANGKNYPVQLNNEQAYVNVPWTDTNTWRGIQNNLTSDSTSDSLSAAQGKVLKRQIDTLCTGTSVVLSSANAQYFNIISSFDCSYLGGALHVLKLSIDVKLAVSAGNTATVVTGLSFDFAYNFVFTLAGQKGGVINLLGKQDTKIIGLYGVGSPAIDTYHGIIVVPSNYIK